MLHLRRRIAVLAALACAALLAAPGAALAGVDRGDRAPELRSVKDARGKRVTLKSYRGKWVVVTFGASWCDPCEKELPAYEKLARAYKGEDVVFLAINIDKDRDKGKAFMSKAGLRVMRAGYDPNGDTADIYDPSTMPTTFVVDPRGLVRHIHKGYRSGDAGKLRKTLEKLRK